MMKKQCAILLATVLTMSTAFTVMAADDVTGEWYANVMGMEMTMNVSEDGTYTIDVMGEEDNGTWTMDGDTFMMDEEMEFVHDGDSLLGDMDGMEFSFSRDPEALIGFVPAEIREDAAIEDFEGEWVVDMVAVMGVNFPVTMMTEELGVEDISLSVKEGGIVDFRIIIPEGEFSLIAGLNLEGTQAEFKDGALQFINPATNEGSADEIWVVNSLEDGTLKLSTDLGEELGEMAFYMIEHEETETVEIEVAE